MDLKFYLNKFAKVDNIEHYTLNTVLLLKKSYENFLEKSEGHDPEFPLMEFGGGKNKGTKISKGKNIYSMFGGEENIPDDFKGIDRSGADPKKKNLPEYSAREARKRTSSERGIQREKRKKK